MFWCGWFEARGMRCPRFSNKVMLVGFPPPPPSAPDAAHDAYAHRHEVVLGYVDDLFLQMFVECSRAGELGVAPRETCAAVGRLWPRGRTNVEVLHAEPRQWTSGYAVPALRLRIENASHTGAVLEVTCTAPTATTAGSLKTRIVGANATAPLVLDRSERLCGELLHQLLLLRNVEAEVQQRARDYVARRSDA